ncbi:MAG TPA: SRPBCC family protein [Candidatus Sulfomarinibacteraceae bacterium]|nr:SRPBCC family protein [Candidatus Sulfomarinibacteraceae bacterium]
MIELTNEIHINRPLQDVWAYVGDPERWHTWRDAMSAPAVKVDDGPIQAGTRFMYESAFMGRTVETEFEVVAYEPQREIVATTDVPIPVRLAFRCEENGDGTRVIQFTEGQVGGFFGIAEPLVRPLMKREFQKSLNKLRAVLSAS